MSTTETRRAVAEVRVRKAGQRGRTDWGWLDSGTPSRSASTTTRTTWASVPCV
jgi:hypothetical protein